MLNSSYKKTIIFLRVNYPSIYKDNSITRGIIFYIRRVIEKDIEFIYKEENITFEGPCITYVTSEKSNSVKEKTVNIEENHPLGRLVDIDVYDEFFKGLSREEMGLDKRKCYLCNEYAGICVRNKNHSIEEVIGYIEKIYNKYNK